MGWTCVHSVHAVGGGVLIMAMKYPFENRMAVEGQRYQEELYSRQEDEDDHIMFVHYDGTVVYEEHYGENEYGEVIYYCDKYECEDCPDYKECKAKE